MSWIEGLNDVWVRSWKEAWSDVVVMSWRGDRGDEGLGGVMDRGLE